jgi:hypothetical protein
LKIDSKDQEELLKKHPVMERYFRMIYQRAYAASERRIRYLYEFSAKNCMYISVPNIRGLFREFRNIWWLLF